MEEKDRYTDRMDGKERTQENNRMEKRVNWNKRGGKEAVVFVPATPHSQLQKRYEAGLQTKGLRSRSLRTQVQAEVNIAKIGFFEAQRNTTRPTIPMPCVSFWCQRVLHSTWNKARRQMSRMR